MTDVAVVRYGEIGTKSNAVKQQMVQTLRQRVEGRLDHEGLEYEKISQRQGRIVAYTEEAKEVAEKIQDLPGIKTVSPALKTESDIESIKEASENLEYGLSFGVDPNTGHTDISSQEIAKEVGAHVESFTGAEVELDNPDTWLGVDVRKDEAYLFTEKLEGPGGFPTGTQGEYAALISGGIDSPVATYRIMTRGASITPIYFYNRPIAAEDHLMRFKASAKKFKKFHPSKKWKAYVVDMQEVNEALMDIGRGRMVLHRRIMFRIAEKIAEEEGLNGLVTGESLGQKSSQTSENLEITSTGVEKPVMRPLLTEDKSSITGEARELGTFEEAKIDSACRSLSPENPATTMDEHEIRKLEDGVDADELVDQAFSGKKEISL